MLHFIALKAGYEENIKDLTKAAESFYINKQEELTAIKAGYEEKAKALVDAAKRLGAKDDDNDMKAFNRARSDYEAAMKGFNDVYGICEQSLEALKVARQDLEKTRQKFIAASVLYEQAKLNFENAKDKQTYNSLLQKLKELPLPKGNINYDKLLAHQQTLSDTIKTTLDYHSVADTWHKQYKSWFNKFEGLQLADNKIPDNIASIFTKLDDDPLVEVILSKATSRENLDDKQKEILANKLASMFKEETKANEFRSHLEKINNNKSLKPIYDQLKGGIPVKEKPTEINRRKVITTTTDANKDKSLIYSLIAINNPGLLKEAETGTDKAITWKNGAIDAIDAMVDFINGKLEADGKKEYQIWMRS